MEKFEYERKKCWDNFGRSVELPPRHYFDLVGKEKYDELLAGRDLLNKLENKFVHLTRYR